MAKQVSMDGIASVDGMGSIFDDVAKIVSGAGQEAVQRFVGSTLSQAGGLIASNPQVQAVAEQKALESAGTQFAQMAKDLQASLAKNKKLILMALGGAVGLAALYFLVIRPKMKTKANPDTAPAVKDDEEEDSLHSRFYGDDE